MEELRFEHIEYLKLLWLIPLLLLLFLFAMRMRKKNWKAMGDESLIRQLTPRFSRTKLWYKFILGALALIFLIVH